LTAAPGYTFDGVAANAFSFSGGDATVTNAEGSDNTIVVSVVFGATDPLSSDASLDSVKQQEITDLGGEDGTSTGNAITGSITLTLGSDNDAIPAIETTDIIVAAGAKVELFTDAAFAVEAEAGIPVSHIGTTHAYIKVTPENGVSPVYYDVSVAVTGNVSAYYTLTDSEESESLATSGLEIASAEKDEGGEITITLKGDVARAHQAVKDGSANLPVQGDSFVGKTWGGGTATSATGRYAGAFIMNLFGTPTPTNIAIKQDNEALKYYTDSTDDVATEILIAPAASGPNIWLPSDSGTPFKWKLYSAIDEPSFGILLWDGATVKTATLDIDQYDESLSSSSNIATVTVDWSGVTFLDKELNKADYLLMKDDRLNKGTEDYDSGLEVTSVTKNEATNTVTITLEGTVAVEYQAVKADDDTESPKTGSAWCGDTWGPGSTTSAVGAYAGVYISGLFPATPLDNVAVRQVNDSFRFYTADLLGSEPEKPVATTDPPEPNIWIPSDPEDSDKLPVKWKFSDLPADDVWAVLLWSEAKVKTAVIEFVKYDGSAENSVPDSGNPYSLTVIVNWGDVKFATE
jgi:hypothetical protein